MDFEYLQDYYYHEKDLMEKHYKTNLDGDRNLEKIIGLQYPPNDRFNKLHEPYSQFVINQFENFWPILPFTGSLFIELYPVKDKKIFQKMYGFSFREIPDIIKFWLC